MKMNTVKTSNKLIGEIRDDELYAGDDLLVDRHDHEDFEGQELDLDLNAGDAQQAAEKKNANGFLSKIK